MDLQGKTVYAFWGALAGAAPGTAMGFLSHALIVATGATYGTDGAEVFIEPTLIIIIPAAVVAMASLKIAQVANAKARRRYFLLATLLAPILLAVLTSVLLDILL